VGDGTKLREYIKTGFEMSDKSRMTGVLNVVVFGEINGEDLPLIKLPLNIPAEEQIVVEHVRQSDTNIDLDLNLCFDNVGNQALLWYFTEVLNNCYYGIENKVDVLG
jgi:hypothetical protein